ncbi:glutathione S-transferase C-terminal domain-containing protein-like [Tropilaelaps mercedesae]|uniref:Glutathione S-transferase C-terminal domain-containing protein-like n=1 Tax=Tropilaelaps mercedesae TaxID=418985 RepID=A0A1V9XGA7_9ACAR|nr:glutathione S-transferase C-terminal domain-containing protein-like [Tropilaelaps mercedesae]
MAWLLPNRGKPLCALIATKEDPVKTVLYLQGTQASLTLDSALCAYTLAFEGVLDVVRVTLVRGGGEQIGTREFMVDNDVLRKARIINEAPDEVGDVELPAVHVQGEHRVIGGLCASIRYILLQHGRIDILGFRAACLAACAQVSLWTSFCERDMPAAVLALLEHSQMDSQSIANWFPKALLLLENHLRTPVRTHNDKHLKRVMKVKELGHDFVEGTAITLSDLLLFFSVHLIFKNLTQHFILDQTIPHVLGWYRRMLSRNVANKTLAPFLSISVRLKKQPEDSIQSNLIGDMHIPVAHAEVEKVRVGELPLPASCLYSQSKVNLSMKTCVKNKDASVLLSALRQYPSLLEENVEFNRALPWDTFPQEMRPESGGLPEDRIQRKRQQISNVVNAVISLVDSDRSQTIVDFCSGGGHVAIVLAKLLPNCRVILVENKYESLDRARQRSQTLGMTNVLFYQCNMDQFRGCFDIGVSLHACGGATDLVIEKCLQSGASFVSVPCCYGAINRAGPLHSALANALEAMYAENGEENVSARGIFGCSAGPSIYYKSLCHFADRNECAEGALCMVVVDSDRTRYITSQGYETQLTNILPLSCTPKNNMIIARKCALVS